MNFRSIARPTGFFIFLLFSMGMGILVMACGGGEKNGNHGVEKHLNSGIPGVANLTLKILDNPEDPELYHDRAVLYYSEGVMEIAEEDWRKAIELDGENPEYYHRLSDVLMDNDRPMDAIEVMEAIVELFPDRIPGLLKLGEMYLIMGMDEKAMTSFNAVLEIEAHNADGLFMVGLTHRETGETENAIPYFLSALEVDPTYTEAYLLMGQILMEQDNDLAERYFSNAIRSAPDNPTVYHALAEYYYFEGKLEKALDVYANMHLRFPSYAEGFYSSGLLLLEQEKLDEAYKMFHMAVQIRPTMARGYFFRGKIYELRGEYNRALDQYDQAISLAPTYSEANEAYENLRARIAEDMAN